MFLIRDLIIVITLISVIRDRLCIQVNIDCIPNIVTSFPLSSMKYFPGKSSRKKNLVNPSLYVYVQSFYSFITMWGRITKSVQVKLHFVKFYLNERQGTFVVSYNIYKRFLILKFFNATKIRLNDRTIYPIYSRTSK